MFSRQQIIRVFDRLAFNVLVAIPAPLVRLPKKVFMEDCSIMIQNKRVRGSTSEI